MIKRSPNEGRHRVGSQYMSQEMASILAAVQAEVGDQALAQSVWFSPTALTHVRRLIDQGGSIITDTMLVAGDIDKGLLGNKGAQVRCFIDDPQVDVLAEQRRVTRAEVAVDYSLTTPGLKLMVIGSAPAAINRLIARRQHEPMTDVCVLAAPSGFASVVQLKERLLDSDLASVVVRGKKGGIPVTVALVNAILREISKG
jgi:precorrin-8X/cobalt-precorrin-8 methylmutase